MDKQNSIQSTTVASSIFNGSTHLDSNLTSNPILLIPNHPNLNSNWLIDWIEIDPIVLVGYQLWAVEQSVTDRDALLPFIVASSGNDQDVVERYILKGSSSIPGSIMTEEQEATWQETKQLFKSFGSRMTETPHGFVPLTSLPSLSPSLSIVLVPNGDYLGHLKQLYLNINLRRLGLGGRSGGLRLIDASPAQQLHFRQAFRLPIPPLALNPSSQSTPSNQSFADTVLELVALVQNALALFGLGVVKVEMVEEAEMNYDVTMEGESRWRLQEGDGLLCDTTLAGLSLFRVDIGEPFLRLAPDDSVLSPPLLAALISLVVSTRGKLIACGASSVPKDPFERRAKFLRACQSFQQANSLPQSPYLTLSYLSTLSSIYARNRHPDSVSTTSKVSRALRHRLDASLALVVDPNNTATSSRQRGSVLGGGIGSNDGRGGEEIASFDLEEFAERVLGGEKGVGGSTVGKIWGAKIKSRKGRHVYGSSIDRHTSRLKTLGGGGDSAVEVEGWNSPTSESDSQSVVHHGFGRGVLKGVKEKAGRAGRILSDNLGSVDIPPSYARESTDAFFQFEFVDSLRVNTPLVILSPDPEDTQSRTGDEESSTVSFSTQSNQPPYVTPPQINPESTRMNTSLRTTSNLDVADSSAGESSFSNITKAKLPPSGSELPLDLRKIPGRKHPRRIMSEAQGVLPTVFRLASEDGDVENASGAIRKGITRRQRSSSRKRRHSFNIMIDAPEPWIIVSRKRLEMEVNLRMAVWNLVRREKNLVEMVEALEIVKNSYNEALSSLSSPYQTRLTRLSVLQQTSHSLLNSSTTLTSSSVSQSPLNTLLTNSSKLSYSQSLLEEKLKDVEGFKERLENKLGSGSAGMNLGRLLKGNGVGCSDSTSGKGWWSFIFGAPKSGKEKEVGIY